jgi:5-methylcytosine-specific restriction endonuclease McrA
VILDPPPALSQHSNDTFYLHSHEVDARIDVHSTAQLLDALEGSLCRTGVTKKQIEVVRTQAQSDPRLSPFDALVQFGPFRENESVIALLPFRAMWNAHPALTLTEIQNRCAAALCQPIRDLKANGELALVRDYWAATLRTGRIPESLLEPLATIVSQKDEWTLTQVTKRIFDVALHAGLIANNQQIWNAMVASLQFYPEFPCVRCGETTWGYESLSPSGKAATWRCGYCRKTTIVKVDDIKRKASTANREPIPKKVQAEVWQRDGGKCVVCGSKELLEFDHIIAVCQGGSNTARNIQLLCQACNRKKSGKPPGEI